MIVAHKYARKAAQWVVDSVMGNGLAQQEGAQAVGGGTSPELAALCRQAAAEGCVLLSNDGTLPLDPTAEVAVFGRCQLDWFHMGHGSGGDVHAPYLANLMDGLQAAGVAYNRVLAEVYRSWCTSPEHAADSGWWGHWPTHYPEMPVSRELAQAAAQTAQVAVVVIGRTAGEDLDLPLEAGGYYLSEEEKAVLTVVTSTFAHTVVVLNTGNLIDLSWTASAGTTPSATLLAWQGGMEAGNAVADVLYGKVNPSGCLAATAARDYAAYPSSGNFGNKQQVDYSEGIFVGYRHFLTHAPNDVLYGFGHGLSYTSFQTQLQDVRLEADKVIARVRVQNTGSRAGKKVVQLMCEPPRSGLPKPARVLAAFDKTCDLSPGASQELDLVCDLQSIASYHEDAHAFVLDAGTYWFKASAEGPALPLEVKESQVVRTCTPLCHSSAELRERILQNLPQELPPAQGASIAFADVASGQASLDDFVAQLTDDELDALTRGEGAMNSTLGTPGNAGAFGGVTKQLRARGVPAAICSDGPSGARLARHASLLPCATALACSWNTSLVQSLYQQVGAELRGAGVDVLLAPGMNIQRDPRCGRNFEYFSEDPLLTGLMATAVVRGLQAAGTSACPKHFACNNQEVRRNSCDSRMSERALREVYLRGFEVCVRQATPDLLMTSYNKVNGVWAHYNYDLATTVLRADWGFTGVVITDWWMRPAASPEFPDLRNNAYRVRAGVDVLMPGSLSHVLPVRGKAQGVTRAELQRTARRVLSYLAKR